MAMDGHGRQSVRYVTELQFPPEKYPDPDIRKLNRALKNLCDDVKAATDAPVRHTFCKVSLKHTHTHLPYTSPAHILQSPAAYIEKKHRLPKTLQSGAHSAKSHVQ
jgi:hypothetical protein